MIVLTNLEYAALYSREINKLVSELKAYRNDTELWSILPGTINSGGHLIQHLIGNLRTYIGLTLGNTPYTRDRDAEFGQQVFNRDSLLSELQVLQSVVDLTLNDLSGEELQKEYPHDVLSLFQRQTVSMILAHLLNHLGYHLGQINYHRRRVSQAN